MQPHRQQPTRLPHPWDSPGKNTGVGCHFLLRGMKVKSESEVAQSCPTLCDPMDCSPPGSSVHGIFQARVLERVAISFSNHASQILLFYRWKVFGNCTLSKSVGAIFPTAFAYFMFLSHFGNSYISDFFIIIFVMVICDE